MSLCGVLIATASTAEYSGEPTGVAFDPELGELFVSDDNADALVRVAPGADEMLHTGDDVLTLFDTKFFDSNDPEDVAVDPDSGHLFIVGQPTTIVVETTSSGSLVRVLDISAAAAVKPAGLVVAPGSVHPDDPSLYIVDRGIDNAVDRDENDGKIYEFSLSLITTNFPPDVDVGPDRAVVVSETVELRGTVLDDGVPDSPGDTRLTWSQVNGAGTVTFGDVNASETLVSFSIAGEYVLRLVASDGDLLGSDELTVTVTGTLGEHVTELAVADSTDDAEERFDGAVRLRSTDLEMVFDSGGNQTIGLRFDGVDVPRLGARQLAGDHHHGFRAAGGDVL